MTAVVRKETCNNCTGAAERKTGMCASTGAIRHVNKEVARVHAVKSYGGAWQYSSAHSFPHSMGTTGHIQAPATDKTRQNSWLCWDSVSSDVQQAAAPSLVTVAGHTLASLYKGKSYDILKLLWGRGGEATLANTEPSAN
jgi:hypothetical protein